MKQQAFRKRLYLLLALGVFVAASPASANTIEQNMSWTIDRPETTTKYRIVAYGDSIFAGYKGSISRIAIWAAPSVDGDYLSHLWGTDVEIIRRVRSGAKAGEIYESKIVGASTYMEDPSTRVVAFEMCGNDALQARNNFSGQSGTCNYSGLETALANCTTYLAKSMVFINAVANPGTLLKIVSNLYYAGYAADNRLADCTDAASGLQVNQQNAFLPYLLRMNWRACHFASQYGFRCADNFAQYMGGDYDSNADGRIDSRALRYRQGESENAYVTRLGSTLRATIRDPNTHFVKSGSSYDYIQSDDTHPTYDGGTSYLGFFGGSVKGSSAPRFAATQYVRGKNPLWRKLGHERMGWAMSAYNPAAP